MAKLSKTALSGDSCPYNGLGNIADQAYSIVYGANDNIYTAGYSCGSGTRQDFTVISLTTAGDTNWVYRYNGPWNSWDEAYSLVYGSDGNIYAAGLSNADLIVISLTTTGDTNWVYRYNGPGDGWDEAHSIVYGSDGNIYAAGYSGGIGTERDFTVISLTTTGDTNWVYRYNGPGNNLDEAHSIVYGSDGNIYAAGYSQGNGPSDDFTVISLTTAGNSNWVYRYGSLFISDVANSVVYGSDGNIYAAGYSYNVATSQDFTVISLTTAGDTNWVYRYSEPGNYNEVARSIVYGTDNNIYAAGYRIDSITGQDVVVISLATTGALNWVYRYNGPENSPDAANTITYGSDGNIYAAGYTTDTGTSYDFIVISLDPDYAVKEVNNIALKTDFGATIQSGPLKLPQGKSCRVFDITGRVVTPEKMQPGIYFIEIERKITQKVIKVK